MARLRSTFALVLKKHFGSASLESEDVELKQRQDIPNAQGSSLSRSKNRRAQAGSPPQQSK